MASTILTMIAPNWVSKRGDTMSPRFPFWERVIREIMKMTKRSQIHQQIQGISSWLRWKIPAPEGRLRDF
jgi:hypothetical protein